MKKWLYTILAVLSIAWPLDQARANTADAGPKMIRYYNRTSDKYLFTVYTPEIEKLKGMPQFENQGAVLQTAARGTKMYRFYHRSTGRYVFTGKQNEMDQMKKNGWKYEGFAFYSGGKVPVYRLFHPKTAQHFYTIQASEIADFVGKGWKNEGVGFYATEMTEVKTEVRTVTTPFTKTSQYSEDVPNGKTEVAVAGVNEEVEETYQVTYVNGIKKSEVKSGSRILRNMVQQVEVIGTGLPTYLWEWDYRTSKFAIVQETDTSKDTVGELARLQEKTDHVLYTNNYAARTTTPVYTHGEMDQLTNQYFDVQAFNQAFLNLVNAHRQANGVAPINLNQAAIQAATIRSQEQAAIGDLRTNGQPHTRPDGRSWTTVQHEVAGLGFLTGENILARGDIGLYELLHEDQLASLTFEQWKNSPGHNANMLSARHDYIGVGVGFSRDTLSGSKWPFIATTIFSAD